MKILAIDIGGSKLKALASGQAEPRKAPSGPELNPLRLVEEVRELTADWEYEAVSIGVPAPVGDHGPRAEPGNLGSGWVGFNFAAAFDRPVKVVNDAAMQALGSYDGGRMLFLGLGTGLGSALIAERTLIALELGRLPFPGKIGGESGLTFGEVFGRAGLKRFGRAAWRRAFARVVPALIEAFLVDDVVIGGGGAKKLEELPHGVRLGHNLTAFRGGFRLWGVEDVPVQSPEGGGGEHAGEPESRPAPWRMI